MIRQKNSQDSINGVDFNFQPFNISKSRSKFHESSASIFPGNIYSISNFSDQQPISFQDTTKNLQDFTMIKQKHENLNGCSPYSMKTPEKFGQQQGQGVRTITRSPLQAKEHVLAERKRREKLNQQFISLSAIIPGIKKMNKESVLKGTTKYLKELQEREKKLVEQSKKKTPESAISVKKSQILNNPVDASSSPKNFHGCSFDQLSLPDILVRVSDKNVLIRIHCLNQNGYIVKILREIEKF